MAFQKAVKTNAKLRLALTGGAGSGKTFTALTLAKNLGTKIAVIDTEHGSASKYADIFDFDVLELAPPYHPQRFCDAIIDASEDGYDVIIIDSISHAWAGTGGVLELVENAAELSQSKNSYAAWKNITPVQNQLVETILAAPIHVICTMRAKQEYVIVEKEKNGRKIQAPEKIGLAPIQRAEFEYEFDVVLMLDQNNIASVMKTRCPELQGAIIQKPDDELAKILKNWLIGEKSPKQEALEKARRRFHAIGKELHGKNWDAKRHEIIEKATEGKATSTNDLNVEWLNYLADGLQKKLNAQLDAAAA